MNNPNPLLLEFLILILAFLSVTILTALNKIPVTDAVPILTGIITYGVGAARGTTSNIQSSFIQQTAGQPVVQQSDAAQNSPTK